MTQNWTKERPTQDGYYWAKRVYHNAEIMQIENGKGVTHTLYGEPLRLVLEKSLYREAEWLGPIAPPAYPGKEKKPK